MQLNAYDKRRVEEPDYEQRMEAFETLDAWMMEKHALTTPIYKYRDIAVPLVAHTCTHMLTKVRLLLCCYFEMPLLQGSDVSLREHARMCMRSLILWLAKADAESDERSLFDKLLLPIVRNGLKHREEVCILSF